MRLLNALLILVPLAMLPGCASDTASSNTCKSGQTWTGGDSESPSMNPGQDCIACHAKGEGPKFSIAGTVYPLTASHDANDCLGSSGATIEITDKTGQKFTMTANASGNFYLEAKSGTPVAPYRAKIIQNGRERVMNAEQAVGSCNSCHTPNGAFAAPGRILLPEPASKTTP